MALRDVFNRLLRRDNREMEVPTEGEIDASIPTYDGDPKQGPEDKEPVDYVEPTLDPEGKEPVGVPIPTGNPIVKPMTDPNGKEPAPNVPAAKPVPEPVADPLDVAIAEARERVNTLVSLRNRKRKLEEKQRELAASLAAVNAQIERETSELGGPGHGK